MATDFPTSVDVFVNPTAYDNHNTATVPHYEQHANANDAIVAIETALIGSGGVAGATAGESFTLVGGKLYGFFADSLWYQILPQTVDGVRTLGIADTGAASPG